MKKLEDQLKLALEDEETHDGKSEANNECYCEAQSDCDAWGVFDRQLSRVKWR